MMYRSMALFLKCIDCTHDNLEPIR